MANDGVGDKGIYMAVISHTLINPPPSPGTSHDLRRLLEDWNSRKIQKKREKERRKGMKKGK